MYQKTLSQTLQKKLEELRKQRAFDAGAWIEARAQALNAYLAKTPLSTVVVSVSGGIDSSVTVALVAFAKKLPNSPIKRIVGLMQPIHSTYLIYSRALLLAPYCELFELDQSEIFDYLHELIDGKLQTTSSAFAKGNLKSYMRTPTAFYTAQLLNGVVVGTGNYDEDGFLYYFSKAGDGVSDIQLIHDLHKSEVYRVGEALNLDPTLLNAVPSADLWEGQTDENEIGYGYDHVELLTELLRRQQLKEFEGQLAGEVADEFAHMKRRLFEIHERNSHKAKFPLNIE